MVTLNDAKKIISAGMTNVAENGQRMSVALAHIDGIVPDQCFWKGMQKACMGKFDISIKYHCTRAFDQRVA
jgi:hypothetical protein